jgi:squalene-hopene/tetraprenyl-beta-curcumene cyclase
MTATSSLPFLDEFLTNTRRHLLNSRGAHGHWEGALSSSALSTATAVIALEGFANSPSCEDRLALKRLIDNGLSWLTRTQNADGGWGDTILSHSNISTTSLVWAAYSGHERVHWETVQRCEGWLRQRAGNLEPAHLSKVISDCYGKDRTFSVPILTTLALRDRLGNQQSAWKLVPQLPFELAAFPHKWYARLKLPVVSYALPALIAIGLVRHTHRPTRNPVALMARYLFRERTLRVLEEIQPSSGGFLEATPLTSFVALSLVGAGLHDYHVTQACIQFLIQSVREDGSWPIDTNLATWLTTLAVNALNPSTAQAGNVPLEFIEQIREWVAGQQSQVEHPYTHAAPGAWAWTDLPGGVPDADDTSGALIAMHELTGGTAVTAAQSGVRWLLDLQNHDGGIPTFCKGWGLLPFDRSSADITAHALRAWSCWHELLPADLQERVRQSSRKALHFLKRQQNPDGSWAPLWFGNQDVQGEQNLVYGTSRVLLALSTCQALISTGPVETPDLVAGTQWLLNVQNSDGGWGGAAGTPSSIEETALALEALAATNKNAEVLETESANAIRQGLTWLAKATEFGKQFPPSPIGFYFARLWYYEKLYPVIYTMAALTRARQLSRQLTPAAVTG